VSDRLSEEALIQSLDSGWRSLVWRDSLSGKNSVLSPAVDFKAILDCQDPEAAAQAIARRDMYLALVSQGPEDALEVLPLLSQEQFVSILDNEAWHDGHLMVHQAIRWLDLYKHLGTDQLYKRFRQLDEEYQVALLNPYIELVDEDAFEKLSQHDQDKFTALPCNTLWWKVKDGDEKVQEFVTSVVSAAISEDPAYVYSLLGMAAMLPPNEQEALLKQFRDARLEEDGFVCLEESRELFSSYVGAQDLLQKWTKFSTGAQSRPVPSVASGGLFLDSVMGLASKTGIADSQAIENVQRGFAFLANAVSSACQVQPDDVNGLTSLLQQVKCISSLGLEILAQGDEAKAVEVLFTEYPKTVFKFALATFDAIRLEAISGLRTMDDACAKKLELLWRSGKFGAALWLIDKGFLDALGAESVEILKGLFNRFPMVKDEIISDENIWRVRFRPVATTADYQVLLGDVRKVFSAQIKEPLQ